MVFTSFSRSFEFGMGETFLFGFKVTKEERVGWCNVFPAQRLPVKASTSAVTWNLSHARNRSSDICRSFLLVGSSLVDQEWQYSSNRSRESLTCGKPS